MEESRSALSAHSKRAPVVLLIDDFEDARDLSREYLSFSGFRVITGTNGTEALQLARSHRPDLILLDIQMRDLSGLDVVRILRTAGDFAATPIVALHGPRPRK